MKSSRSAEAAPTVDRPPRGAAGERGLRVGTRAVRAAIVGLLLVHVYDVLCLPFGTMSDSLAYLSFGFDVVGLNARGKGLQSPLMPPYQQHPYFPLGYPLLLGLLARLSRPHVLLLAYTVQHLLVFAVEAWFLTILASRRWAFVAALVAFALIPELHLYPQTVMSEAVAIPLHAAIAWTLYRLAVAPTRATWLLYAAECVGLVMVRGAPFLVVLAAVGLLALGGAVSPLRAVALGLPPALGVGIVMVANWFIVGAPVLTTSTGQHLHNRLVFAQQFPLMPENAAQAEIVAAIGEAKYRTPNFWVMHHLWEAGYHDPGFHTDQLLADACRPYLLRYPGAFLAKSVEIARETMLSANDHDFGRRTDFENDREARKREIHFRPFGDAWSQWVFGSKLNWLGPCYLAVLVVWPLICFTSRSPARWSAFVFVLYPGVAVFVASCLSYSEQRRLRELFLVMVLAVILAAHEATQRRAPETARMIFR